MALDNYANLKQAIEKWSHRSDVSNVIDDFIDLAEDNINSLLKLRSNETRATASTSTTDRYLALPDSMLKIRRLRYEDSSNNPYCLVYVPPESLDIITIPGKPRNFTITSQIEFDRASDVAYTVEIQYYKKLTPLSDSNTTNNVLTEYPKIYLYGALAALFTWSQDTEMASNYHDLFEQELERANREEKKGRYGPVPAMRVKGPIP